jgi:hypothetical protein
VKWVAPRDIAHSLMACATVGAMSRSSFFPCRIALTSFSYACFGSLARIWRTPNVLIPK